MSNPATDTQVIADILASFAAQFSAAGISSAISDTYKSAQDWGDADLEPGIYTVISSGNPPSDVNLYYLDVVILAQTLILPATLNNPSNGTKGAQINQVEGAMLDNIRTLCRGLDYEAEILNSKRSMQLDEPYCWVMVDARVGPYSMDDQPLSALQPLVKILTTIDATAPDGSEPSVSGTASPAQT